MHKRSTVNFLIQSILAASIGSAPAAGIAQTAEGPARNVPRQTQAEREAAADRARAKGFVAPSLTATLKVSKEPKKKNGTNAIDLFPVGSVATMAAPGSAPHYFSVGNYANSPLRIVDQATGTVLSAGIRKFVDTLPGLGPDAANNLGQFIPVAVPDTTTYPGSDYYEIAVVDFEEQMHSDLPETRLRGYVQLSTSVVPGAQVPLLNPDGSQIRLPNGQQARGVTAAHYLGPAIAAQRDRPVRILFRNLLRSGAGGNLFVPVDVSVMGAGIGPNAGMDYVEANGQQPLCDAIVKDARCYTENRAVLHLHGGITPWISDGTPHQWITPANDPTLYKQGVSMQNVPDMPDPGPGAQTYFYTNQQSARLLFYHDHSWGITRLNVYVGEAAPYLITDPTEQALIDAGTIPGPDATIPLVVQDKTFVPLLEQLAVQDPTWDIARWGGFGSLWMPHVYVPAQNPGDSSGVNEFGRWAYGPWFWPPTTNIDFPPIPNPYYDETCNPDTTWCEPPLMPGTPYVSMGMEAFNDTPVVNGTVYPTVTLEPKAYRFRILNAANDRFFNLSLYEADPAAPTEVQLNPAEVAAALDDSTIFPTPIAGTEGPDWIQIGTEGGFLPTPVVIPAHPTTWVNDPTVFNAGNVDQHSLLLGPAERADVVVDFSQFAGQTLILYNDAPAAFPARDPRYDYYTGSADYTDTGGVPPIIPGYGPNTRTVMQIKVAAARTDGQPVAAYDLAPLDAAFAHKADGSGVFESSANPIVVGQGAYNLAYGTTWQNNGPYAGLAQIFDKQLTFDTVSGLRLTMPMISKAIQDEMGEAFDKEYGRMSGNLGLEAPSSLAGQQILILYPFVNPATEVMDGIELPPGVDVTPITDVGDGSQMWKITHNGVDTHPIHFHLFDVQLVNRVGWDGIIRKPEPSELGWKDTVRISPLEDTIVVMRPIIPKLPFGVPDSVRPLNPMMPLGSQDVFVSVDGFGNPMNPPITNELTNFGWEYVWHCHILSHEEMDMMRPIAVSVDTTLPDKPTVVAYRQGGNVIVTWSDTTPPAYLSLATWGDPKSEVGFRIERATGSTGGTFAQIGTSPANTSFFTDPNAATGTYRYRVVAYNASGSITSDPVLPGDPPGPATGVTLTSDLQSPQPPGTPVTFTAQAQGTTLPAEYQFWLDDGTGWSIAQAFSADSTWVLQNAVAGNYWVAVWARTTPTVTDVYGDAIPYSFVGGVATPATSVELTASPQSPSTAGTPVVFTAVGSGSTTGGLPSPASAYDYQFWVDDGTGWTIAQPYGVGSTYTMNAPAAGTYLVAVWTRTSSTVTADVYGSAITHVVGAAGVPTPATGVSLTAAPLSPSAVGASVTFTAAGSGSTTGGLPSPDTAYEYQFWLDDGTGWAVAQPYGVGSTYTLVNPDAGTYFVAAWVRTSPIVQADFYGPAITHVVGAGTPTPATGVTLTPTPASPSAPGVSVIFTATGSGSTTDGLPSPDTAYEYQFWLDTGAGWEIAQAYGVGSTYTLTTPAAGTYNVAVWVRTSPTVTADVYGDAQVHLVQ